jgi:DNA-binding NtrC family response regulator
MSEKTRVLIVDDDYSMLHTTALVLEGLGYAVDVAGDGDTAIEKARQADFDVILMDIKMPLMDGVETYKRIKAIHAEAAVIMMTAYAVEDLVAEALQEGACGVIYKPLDFERTVGLIEKTRREGKRSQV